MKQKLPTIKEIAQRLNISPSTVSRALHDHPSIGLRTKMQVQKLAAALHYEPNQTAIFFKQRKTFTIGVVLPELTEFFFSRAISGIEDIAVKHNYNVLFGQSHDDVEREKQIIIAMKNQRVDGVIASLAKHTRNYDHFMALQKYNIPVVFFDRVPSLGSVHKVSFNMTQGTQEALLFLIGQGHRRIGVLNGPEEMRSSKQRTDTYQNVLQKKKIKIDLSLIVSTDLTKEGTKKAMQELLSRKPRPTAILAINDYVAMDAIQFVRAAGYKMNEDICFVSYANLPITSYLDHRPMASVEQYPYEQGAKAFEILMQVLAGEGSQEPYHTVEIDGRLIVHEKSLTGPNKPAAVKTPKTSA